MRLPKGLPLQALDYYRKYCLYTALLIVASMIFYGTFYALTYVRMFHLMSVHHNVIEPPHAIEEYFRFLMLVSISISVVYSFIGIFIILFYLRRAFIRLLEFRRDRYYSPYLLSTIGYILGYISSPIALYVILGLMINLFKVHGFFRVYDLLSSVLLIIVLIISIVSSIIGVIGEYLLLSRLGEDIKNEVLKLYGILLIIGKVVARFIISLVVYLLIYFEMGKIINVGRKRIELLESLERLNPMKYLG